MALLHRARHTPPCFAVRRVSGLHVLEFHEATLPLIVVIPEHAELVALARGTLHNEGAVGERRQAMRVLVVIQAGGADDVGGVAVGQ